MVHICRDSMQYESVTCQLALWQQSCLMQLRTAALPSPPKHTKDNHCPEDTHMNTQRPRKTGHIKWNVQQCVLPPHHVAQQQAHTTSNCKVLENNSKQPSNLHSIADVENPESGGQQLLTHVSAVQLPQSCPPPLQRNHQRPGITLTAHTCQKISTSQAT